MPHLFTKSSPTRTLKFSRQPHIRSTYFIFALVPRIASRLTRILCTNILALPFMTDISPFSTIAEISASIRSRKASPVEILEAHFRRIESLQPKLNAFVHLDAGAARAQARAAEAAVSRGQVLGLLHGVPVTLKSCIDVAGWPCPAGSLLPKDYLPATDAPLVARLRAAGAILLGNAHPRPRSRHGPLPFRRRRIRLDRRRRSHGPLNRRCARSLRSHSWSRRWRRALCPSPLSFLLPEGIARHAHRPSAKFCSWQRHPRHTRRRRPCGQTPQQCRLSHRA